MATPFRLITLEDYKCTLTPEAQRKAEEELGEDPKERLNCVKQLIDWIKNQPHIKTGDAKYAYDTVQLLSFLRTRKFSQLRTREMMENFLTSVTQTHRWFGNIDTRDPKIEAVMDTGHYLPLPRKDKNGCQVVIIRMAAINPDKMTFSSDDMMRAGNVWGIYSARDENNIVNGTVIIIDCTNVTLKHTNILSYEDSKLWHKTWQNSLPGRYKAIHIYNAGMLFEAVMAIFRPFQKKKFRDRTQVHNTAEHLYKAVGKDVLPLDYLPDDYNGPNSGTCAEILADFKNKVQADNVHKYILEMTSEEVSIDASKKITETEQASFRKLNIE